ncbi:MAG1430 family protein [Mycoplasma sp. 1018B]|uniref:MAG1430 family protein n=1 Tax=Mycoplasma sp. 1018B TaxID=2967302 RepID=UPI00211CFB37|nr:hypothetical protein [Mycoplasma sp. 1018B]UUM19218.1 hypothetical protein NPA14_02730 [Mycoplasma sp. 1018B]
MKRFKLKLGLLISGITAGIITITGLTFLTVQTNQNDKLDNIMKNYHFKINYDTNNISKLDLTKHFASEFVYSSKEVFQENQIQDPNYKNNSAFWHEQLEINPTQGNKKRSNEKIFVLEQNDKTPIDILFNSSFDGKYNIYYQSFANDKEGKLFLKVYLENKNNNNFSSQNERIQLMKQFIYVIDGFKKYENNEIENTDINYRLWDFQATEKLNIDYSQNLIPNLNILFLQLPQKDETNEIEIEKNNKQLKSLIKYDIKNYQNKNHYLINENKSIWFTKVDNNNLIINYYLEKIVPVASIENLFAVENLKIITPQQQLIKFNFEELKAMAAKVKINILNNADLSQSIPNENNLIYYQNANSNDIQKNTATGLYKPLDLIINSSQEDQINYSVEYYLNDPLTGTIKTEEKNRNTPLVTYNNQTGSATFAFKIELKNKSPLNGLLSFIGTYTLEKTFKNSNN